MRPRKGDFFAAGIKVVGQYGHAEASVGRITAEAGVAQGALYLHFENRQTLLDQLLPFIGDAIVNAVQDHVDECTSDEEREIERCKAFFDALAEVPEFFRIRDEAELFAPQGYREQTESVVAGYVRSLRRGFDAKDPDGYTDDELEVVAHFLLGARACLGKRYANLNPNRAVPDHVISAYSKLMRHGLFPEKSAIDETSPTKA